MPEQKKELLTNLDKVSDQLVTSVEKSLENLGLAVTDYQKQCMISALAKMNELRTKREFDRASSSWNTVTTEWNKLDIESIKNVLIQVAESELSVSTFPAEATITRRGNAFTFAPQGEGWRKLTQKYGEEGDGVKVKAIYEPWIVREGDDYKFPHYAGLKVTPPEWTPKGGNGKVVRVVYPVLMSNDREEYLSAERESVKTNILMAINNNLMKDKNRDSVMAEINAKAQKMTLDQLLADSEIAIKGKLSDAWTGPSQEQMIIRKLKNNALKNFPKNYHSTLIASKMENIAADSDEDAVSSSSSKVIDISADTDSVKQINDEVASKKLPPVKDFEASAPVSPKVSVHDAVLREPAKKKEEPKKEEDELPF